MKQYNTTDLGNSQRLIDRYGQDMRYVPQWGWMVYDGSRWIRDASKDSIRVMELAKNTVRAMYGEAEETEDANNRRLIADWARQSESLYRVKAMVELAQSEPAIRANPQDFDNSPWLLNFSNGTVDLKTGELHAHNRSDLITRMSPVEYNPLASSDVWSTFLSEVFQGDTELIGYVQRAIGYGATGLTTEDKMFIPWGGGRNGKSTLFNIVQETLGDYATTANATLVIKQGEYAKNYDLAELTGVRFVTIFETESGKRLDTGRVKQMTGGDAIRAEYKYKDSFTFKPQFKLFLSTNNKPEVDEQTTAIWARLKLIPFNVSFLGREDFELESKLRDILPAIATWIVEGALLWQIEGLNEPDSVKEATEEYKQDQDDLGDFIAEECEIDKEASIKAHDLYDMYRTFMQNNDEPYLDTKAFKAQMEQRGYKSKRKNTGVVYQGIGKRKEPLAMQQASEIIEKW